MKTLIVIDMQNDFISEALGTPEAQAIILTAEAEAEANRKLAASLTDAVLEKMYYEKWNGILPTVYGADNAIVNVP